jgi:hypothetical protein
LLDRAPDAIQIPGMAGQSAGDPIRHARDPISARRPYARSWSLTKGAVSGTLVLRFVGPTPTAEIPGFLGALDEHMPPREAHIVFDVRELVGHNVDTRVALQRWLLDHRPRIAQVTVVVNKAATLVKMATSVVSMAARIKIKIRDDLEGEASVLHLRA